MENTQPAVIKRLMKEMGELQKSPIDGIKVNFENEDLTQFEADIAGPGEP